MYMYACMCVCVYNTLLAAFLRLTTASFRQDLGFSLATSTMLNEYDTAPGVVLHNETALLYGKHAFLRGLR